MNQFRKKIVASVLAIFLSLGFATQTRALTFNITYDSSVTSQPNAAQIETAFGIATQTMQALYTNSSSVNITVFFSSSVGDRKSTRLNSSHQIISYAVFCLKKKKIYGMKGHEDY